MPFIPFELDALNAAPDVARLAGVSDDSVIAGLVRLWARVLRTGVPTVTTAQVAGLFGGPGPSVAAALAEFGFLEAVEEEWRVKGDERLINAATARSRGGHAAKKHLIPGARHRAKSLSADLSALMSPENLSAEPREPLGCSSALSPTTNHQPPTTNTKSEALRGAAAHDADAEPAPPVPETTLSAAPDLSPPAEPFALEPTNGAPKPRKRSEAQQFWDWAQSERQRVKGLVPEAEPDPPQLNRWFRDAIGVVGDVNRLWAGYQAYVMRPHDDFWTRRGWPFRGFMSDAVWRRYVPPEVRG